MKLSYELMLQHVSLLNKEDKNFLLEDAVIDEGILDVCNALNEYEWISTMNSCQGGGESHCPITYVDFYVLNHEYEKANALMIYLMKNVKGSIHCEMTFEEDGFVDENDTEFFPNGDILYRYRIECLDGYDKETLEDLADRIRFFKDQYC